jgi:hypothetical protein
MTGVEVIENNEPQYTCKAELVQKNVEANVALADVLYKGSITPSLTSIEPRFGQVQGGTSVTFTGTNFVTD